MNSILNEALNVLGMWGVKINSKRLQIAQAITNLFHTPINASTAIVQYGIDQLLLNLHIWPLAINDMVRFKKRISKNDQVPQQILYHLVR